jgi:O-acetyl-ADP-ribose deacetylase (regulator of RNase III)
MKVTIGDSVLELMQGDITQQDVDVIVNAANGALSVAGVLTALFIESAGRL